MGMMRKAMSIGSAGLVSFNSPKEKQANAAARSSRAQAKLARAETALLKAQAKALKQK